MTSLNPRITRIKPSATLSLNARAQDLKAQGENVIALVAGEPDFAPPQAIVAAAHRALDEGKSKYTAASGLPELRQLLAGYVNQKFGLQVSAENIVLSAGGKQALHNVFSAVLEPGDEVLLPVPWWVSYLPQLQWVDAIPVEVPMPQEGFLNFEAMERLVNSKTKMFILNSPNNPSGQVLTSQELDQLEDFVVRHNLLLLSDELYSSLVYGVEHFSPAARSELAERTLTIGGFSKCYAMTGWRLGYSITTPEVAQAISAYQSHTTSNPNSLVQYAVLYALDQVDADVEVMRQAFDKRRHLVVEALQKIPGVVCSEPKGAFYAFPNVQELLDRRNLSSDTQLCEEILEKSKVAVVPGSAFGQPGHFRLSYALGEEDLQEALQRICDYST